MLPSSCGGQEDVQLRYLLGPKTKYRSCSLQPGRAGKGLLDEVVWRGLKVKL